jgi:hypothetical protein
MQAIMAAHSQFFMKSARGYLTVGNRTLWVRG